MNLTDDYEGCVVEAYRQAELQSVFGSECIPVRDALRPENLAAELRWVTPTEAEGLTREENLRVLLRRVTVLLAG